MTLTLPRSATRLTSTNRWRDFDFVLFVCTLLLIGFGVVVIDSVSGGATHWTDNFAVRQLIATTIGLVLMSMLTLLNFRLLMALALPVYALSIILLVLVERFGLTAGGSTRWFEIGPFLLQPSQFAQLFMVISMATLLKRWERQLRRWPYFLLTLPVMAVPAFLIFRQPDLGSSLVFGFMWLTMILASTADRRFIVVLLLLSIPLGWFGWQFLAQDYMKERFTTFLHPEADATGEGYNIIQARIAIGSGGLLGQGLGGGTQSQLNFLRVQNIDFIFASASEQFGFVGSVAVFILYIVIIWRCLSIGGQAPDSFGTYLCVGTASVYFFQAVVNIGMNMGIMPVTGIPLPFISYGGSSLMVLLAMQGVVQSVAVRRRKLTF
jgi:rod shape determining protein RodA